MASFACRINSSMLCPCAVAVAPACPAMPPPPPPPRPALVRLSDHFLAPPPLRRRRPPGLPRDAPPGPVGPGPGRERADPEPRLVLERRGAHADRPLVD